MKFQQGEYALAAIMFQTIGCDVFQTRFCMIARDARSMMQRRQCVTRVMRKMKMTMPDSAAVEIPPGFEPHLRHSPVTEPWEPIYFKKTADAFILGLRLAKAHTNSRGLAHGGLITTLADNAMGLSCSIKANDLLGLVTVNLSIDFLGSATVGQWLQVETSFVKPGGSIYFAQCFVTADGEPCARANATFKVLRKK